MTTHKALGRGLEALTGQGLDAFFGTTIAKEEIKKDELAVTKIPIDSVFANRSQPREEFQEEPLKNLASSIARDGVLQPLVVSPLPDGKYELIAGERRWRASKMAGLKEVPVIVRTVSQEQRLELALVENVQRENLNSIEEGKGYQQLIDQFQFSAADVAERVGKSREYVANCVRLLKLPKVIQDDVVAGKISAGHARALLALTRVEEQLQMRERILSEQLSVRDIERMIQERGGVRRKITTRHKKDLPAQTKLILDEMQQALGTKVRMQSSGLQEGRGQLVVEFFSFQDLDRIYRTIVRK